MKRIYDFFKKLWKKYKMWKAQKYHNKIVAASKELFQLRELNSELWLIYNGYYVCPTKMLKDDPIDAINKMRTIYIVRKNAGIEL